MSGWTDIPLSPLGWAQVDALARRMASEPAADAVYSSPQQRTVHTARKVAGPRHGPLHLRDDLREIGCGEVDGWLVSRVQERYPELWAENLRQQNPDFRWPGGESYNELRQRSLAALCSLAAVHPGGRVVVVTHAGVISSVLGAIRGESPAMWETCRPGNCSLTILEWEGERGTVIRFDDRSHLAGLEAESPRKPASTRPPGG